MGNKITGKDIFDILYADRNNDVSNFCMAYNPGQYNDVVVDGCNCTLDMDALAERLNAVLQSQPRN